MRSLVRSYRHRTDPSLDGLPEQMAYRDTGCDVSAACLACPLPRCKYDDPSWYQRYRREGRQREVLAAIAEHGRDVASVARLFGVSRRTVHRMLHRAEVRAA
ncbi:MAG: hypothetical protein FJ318_04365 [SAR202 cluster bacterium]|nr:hypothetical protein [SAR202 cluster bacterium]